MSFIKNLIPLSNQKASELLLKLTCNPNIVYEKYFCAVMLNAKRSVGRSFGRPPTSPHFVQLIFFSASCFVLSLSLFLFIFMPSFVKFGSTPLKQLLLLPYHIPLMHVPTNKSTPLCFSSCLINNPIWVKLKCCFRFLLNWCSDGGGGGVVDSFLTHKFIQLILAVVEHFAFY